MSENQKGQGGQRQNRRPWQFRKNKKSAAPPPKPKGNYAFIDSQNLNLGVQKTGWKMDWHKFREWLRTEYNIEQAFMFIGYMPDNEALYEQMYDHGFLVVLKPTVEIKVNTSSTASAHKPSTTDASVPNPLPKPTDKEEKPVIKGNIDADLVLYAMKELPNYDKAVIVTGDGDFFGLIEYLIEQKRLLKVLAPNRRFSTLLQGFEAYIEDIDHYRRELAYHDRHSGRRPRSNPTKV